MEPILIEVKKATHSQYGMWVNNRTVYLGSKARTMGFLMGITKVLEILNLKFECNIE